MKSKVNKYGILKRAGYVIGMVVITSALAAGYLSYNNSFNGENFSVYLFYAAIAFLIFSLVFAMGVVTNTHDGAIRFGEFMVSNKIVSDEQYNNTVPKISSSSALLMFVTGLLLYLLSAIVERVL